MRRSLKYILASANQILFSINNFATLYFFLKKSSRSFDFSALSNMFTVFLFSSLIVERIVIYQSVLKMKGDHGGKLVLIGRKRLLHLALTVLAIQFCIFFGGFRVPLKDFLIILLISFCLPFFETFRQFAIITDNRKEVALIFVLYIPNLVLLVLGFFTSYRPSGFLVLSAYGLAPCCIAIYSRISRLRKAEVYIADNELPLFFVGKRMAEILLLYFSGTIFSFITLLTLGKAPTRALLVCFFVYSPLNTIDSIFRMAFLNRALSYGKDKFQRVNYILTFSAFMARLGLLVALMILPNSLALHLFGKISWQSLQHSFPAFILLQLAIISTRDVYFDLIYHSRQDLILFIVTVQNVLMFIFFWFCGLNFDLQLSLSYLALFTFIVSNVLFRLLPGRLSFGSMIR